EIDFSDLRKAYPQLEFRLFVLPAESSTPPSAESILHLRVENENAVYLLTLGSLPDTKVTAEAMSGLNGKILPIPQWISGSTDNALLSLATRLREEQTQAERIQRHLSTTNETYRLGSLLGELNRLDWLVTHLEGVPVGEYFAHLTGWTSDLDGKRLQAALEAAKLPGAFSIKAHPGDLKAPSLIRNPGWIRPFEFFARLMGTPGTTEADPSPIIAVIAPILFGYMFGDVGHGLVLLTLGLYLRKRWPNLSMLFSGGIVSIVFGFLYGSLFTIETVLNPLWIRPFEDPLILLLMPLLFGATLILSGMALNGFAHLWEGRFTYWLGCEAGIMLAYCSLWLCWVYPQFWTLVVSGVIWHILGNLLWHRQSATDALAHSIGDLLEYLLQLLVNTISFVRVGAFTLAHAGLGISVYSLAESSGHWVWSLAILIAGNIGIIALEGLVVFVQTTRLLLFEFFIRFLKASGRPFLPMVPPTYSPRKEDL
ncbi:MAG: hypothetical protein OEZ23_04810, partial [Gammaproteobacteria bacterium]|nr:hypothetical protein [Gammaproteobacteria bacterium]